MKFDRFFTRMNGAHIESFIFVDTSKTDFARIPQRDCFRYSVEFDVKPYPGDLASNYPVVFTDFTTSDHATLLEIDFASVPPPIKARYTRWLKVQ